MQTTQYQIRLRVFMSRPHGECNVSTTYVLHLKISGRGRRVNGFVSQLSWDQPSRRVVATLERLQP